jgi:hypothetical protein
MGSSVMSPLLLLSIVLQVVCCVHVVRTGRPIYWIFILLFFSYLAVLIYFFAEVLPDLRNGGGARRVARKVQATVDPGRTRRQAEQQLRVADTQTNRRAAAAERLAAGDHAGAATLYRESLKGLYAQDPDLMLGLAQAQYGMGEPAQARATLEALIAANPTFRSPDGHLLYARAVEDSGDIDKALEEYDVVAKGYPGEEARARYGLLLRRQQQNDRARALFQEIVERSASAPRYYQREQKEWIALAKRELAALG